MAKLKRGKGTTLAQKQWYVMDSNKDRRAVPAEEPLGYEYTWAWDMATVATPSRVGMMPLRPNTRLPQPAVLAFEWRLA